MVTTLRDRLEKAFAENPELTKAELARACGVRPPSVSDWFNGRTKRLTGTNLLSAARYLGVSETWLATGRGPMSPSPQTTVQPSQLQRPDPAILVETQAFLERAFLALGKQFSLRAEADLFADVYQWVAEDARPVDDRNLVDFARWRASRIADKEQQFNDKDRSTSSEASRTYKRRAAS